MSSRRIRLLYFTRETFPTHRVDIEVLFGRELAGRGHTVDFVMQAGSADIAAGRHPWHGGTVLVGRTAGRRGFLGKALKQMLAFGHDIASLRLARSECYDAIQVRDKFIIAALGLLVARARGLKFFFWLSFPIPESELLHARSGNARYPLVTYARGLLGGLLLYRWILPKSDHVFAQSARMKEEICARGANPENVTPVPMGVDLDDVPTAMPEPAGQTKRETTLGYLGVLDANRKLDILIDMLADMRRSGLLVRLLLIGDAGERREREELERRAAELGVSEFLQITGFLPRREALRRILAADICLSPIFPSPIFNVASPTKLVEYLALGRPVVANSHPDQRLILRSCRAGICVPWGARYFARAVRWLMKRDACQLEAMGLAGQSWVMANRAYPRIADDVERTYLGLLAPMSGQ